MSSVGYIRHQQKTVCSCMFVDSIYHSIYSYIYTRIIYILRKSIAKRVARERERVAINNHSQQQSTTTTINNNQHPYAPCGGERDIIYERQR